MKSLKPAITGEDQSTTTESECAPEPTANPPSSQNSESTITLSSPSQTSQDPDEVPAKISSPQSGIFISTVEYEDLVRKAAGYVDMKGDLEKIRTFVSNHSQSPVMDPNEFEAMCKQHGAENLLLALFNAMKSDEMSQERQNLIKLRAMVIIYIMIYSQSQKANQFQVSLSRTLQQFGISERGLASLRNLGIAAHPRTIKAATKASSTSHLDKVATFFQSLIDNEEFIVFCIDDYHNIHTKHRPESKKQTQAIHTTTLLVKVFPNIKAIRNQPIPPLLPADPVNPTSLAQHIDQHMNELSQTYASNMPDWVLAKYFDPEAERQRLVLHDYQQTEVRKMRCMDNTKLVDSLDLPLKSHNNLLTAFNHMLSNGLQDYLSHFTVPFLGDWPMQFFMRQLVYNTELVNLPDPCKNVVPLIGPLHISLNSRECVLMNFHGIFEDLYHFLFGEKAKLAKKPKPWRLSLLLEVIYGGWTLVREVVLSAFSHCKDIEYLTLINLVDNYVPLVLSIYSIIFKSNNYDLYSISLLRCWVMFMVFHRRHYDKALLVALSLFQYWQDQDHPMHQTIKKFLVAFDEYPVENFHSVLRARTTETDTADQIRVKAKEIDLCKKELHEFQSAFVPPKRFNFSRKRIDMLKVKAAEFLTKKFKAINLQPGRATQLPRQPKQRKALTKWSLPNLFGQQIVTNKVLPLGFSSETRSPNPDR